MKRGFTTVAPLPLAMSVAAAQTVQVPAIPGYQKTSGVSGNVNSVGSDRTTGRPEPFV